MTTVKKPAIGRVDIDARALARAVYSIKERLEQISGERGDTAIEPLPENATLADVIAKFNRLLDVLQ